MDPDALENRLARERYGGSNPPPLRQLDMKQPRSPKRWPGLSRSSRAGPEELQDQDDDRNDDQDVDEAAERVARQEPEQP